MRAFRLVLGGLGVVVIAWGVRLLLEQGGGNLRATLLWLVGGVVLHDGVLGPATVGVAVLAVLVLRRPVPAPVIVGAVVLVTVSVVAIPVLGRFGTRADNPSLLDRDYVRGWIVFAGLTLLIVTSAIAVRRRKGDADGARTGG